MTNMCKHSYVMLPHLFFIKQHICLEEHGTAIEEGRRQPIHVSRCTCDHMDRPAAEGRSSKKLPNHSRIKCVPFHL